MSPVLILAFDLTMTNGGFVEAGQTGQWGWADPGAGPVGLGACWGTNPNGPYLHDTIDTLTVPLPSLSTLTDPVVVVVRHWYDIAAFDHGTVEVDAGQGWVRLDPVFGYPDPAGFVGTSAGYVEHAFDLSGLGPTPAFRFVFTADPNGARPGWYIQDVTLWDGDIVAPAVSPFIVPVDTQDLDGPYPVTVLAEDDVGIADATLIWQADGGPTQQLPMADLGGGLYTADLPGQLPDTVVSWSVTASDAESTTVWPEDGQESFRVFLAAPTDLTGPTGGHQVDQRAHLTWTPPVSPHPVDGYEVIQQGVPRILVVDEPQATVELMASDSQHFEVRALYDVGAGDVSDPLQLSLEVPDLTSVSPPQATQGERLYVRLEGTSLYLLQGDSVLDAGPGISVTDLDVRDANAATALLEVSDGAEVGPRDLTLEGTGSSWVFRSAFTVTSEELAPRILRITPDTLVQGEEISVEIEATVPFAAVPTVDAGEDLVVTGQISADGTTARFGLAAAGRARVGTHTLVIDDGARRLLADVEVSEYIEPPRRTCATAATGGRSGLALVAWLLLGWRRRGR